MKNSPDSNTQSYQDETPRTRQSLGALLKEGRKSKGKSLEDISKATGIGISKLQALENGERRGLPADVFVRGFIRMISAQIGVDSQDALELFEREWGGRESSDNTSLLQGESFAKSSVILRRWPAFFSILVLGTIFYLAAKFFFPALFVVPSQPFGEILSNELPEIKIVTQPRQDLPSDATSGTNAGQVTDNPVSKSDSRENDEESMPSVIIEQSQNSLPPSKTEAIIEPTNQAAEIKEVTETDSIETTISLQVDEDTTVLIPDIPDDVTHYTLHVKFNERTWVKIALDGQESQEEIFKRNSEKTWDADNSIDLYLGNAGGVNITLNGKPMPLKQESGQTVRLQIP